MHVFESYNKGLHDSHILGLHNTAMQMRVKSYFIIQTSIIDCISYFLPFIQLWKVRIVVELQKKKISAYLNLTTNFIQFHYIYIFFFLYILG